VADASAGELVRAAAQGNQAAWEELVGRYSGLVWSVARSHRLGPADAADVTQTVWLRLVEHLGRIRDADHIGGWLATTTRHECLRVLKRSGREVPNDLLVVEQADDPRESPEWVVLSRESRRLVWLALGRLPQRCQVLLRALSWSPDSSYAEISTALGIPIGSIGPTRMRCLERLRKQLAQAGGLLDDGDG
jgi:RNA polymerase sigma factor (sigma-70 family)